MKKIISISWNSTYTLYALVTALLVFIICINPPIDPDMWWHLKSGQVMWQQKIILTQDQFSFTKINQLWVNAFWIPDLLMYLLVRVGGFPLLIITIGLIGTTTFLTIFLRSSGPLFIRSFVILLAAISVSPVWTARPQVFSFFLLALLNLWMERWKLSKKPPLFLLPVLFVAWANIHGGFIWGFLLIFATLVGMSLDLIGHKNSERGNTISELKQLALWTLISILAVLINPNGLAIWRLPFYTVNVSIAVIQEWFSPNFHNLEMQPFLWIVFLFIIGYSLSEKKQSFDDVLKSLGFTYMAMIAQRNIPLAVIVLAPIIIDKFTEYWSNFPRTRIAENKILVPHPKVRGSVLINSTLILLLVITAVGRVYLQTTNSLIEKIYPVGAMKWVQENQPAGNMFNSYNWGGYLIYNMPDYPVFIDGRADLYGENLINEWWSIAEGNDQSIALLNLYNINFLLIEPEWPIVEILKNKNWAITYQDKVAVVVIRK